jgi:hypothetical protein
LIDDDDDDDDESWVGFWRFGLIDRDVLVFGSRVCVWFDMMG